VTRTPPVQTPPVLVACAHGTADPEGQKAVHVLREQIAACLPGVDVVEASVDVQNPSLVDVVGGLVAQGRHCVIVPLLLSAGFHVFHDVAEVAEASSGLAVAAGALGPDGALISLLAARLAEAGVDDDEPIVLAAAGSSDARAVADVEQVVSNLAGTRTGSVELGYLSAAEPRIEAVVDRRRAENPGRRVVLSTYLLAPGYFYDRLLKTGADVVTAPLAPDPDLGELAARRYRAALA
jgi:sirohydrochlorin ferrochelatase